MIVMPSINQNLQQMNCLRVNSIDKYESELMGYNIIDNKIVYLTQSQLCTIRVGTKLKKQSIKMKGANILNFVISKRGYIAFLLKNKTIQVRRMDNLCQTMHIFANITLYPQQNYPRMRWDYDQLYLVYSDSLQILDVKTKQRKGYTDILQSYDNQQINDIIIANIMDSDKAAILQLRHTLIFTIIPAPITDKQIYDVNAVVNLNSPSFHYDSRRQYIAVLSSNKFLHVFNLLNLKQVCEIDLQPKSNQFLQIQSDANSQCILVRYISSSSLEIVRNMIYKINSQVFYAQHQDYFKDQPSSCFFRYKFQINITQNLTLFPLNLQTYNDELFDYYSLIFFKKGHVYSVVQLIPHSYSQSPTQLKSKTSSPSWYESDQWKDLIQTYLQLSDRGQNEYMFEEQRQLNQYNLIKDEFESIIAKFTKQINEQGRTTPLTENTIQQQWDDYMVKIAKQRNFLVQTMRMFKIQPQIIRKEPSPSNQIENCINDINSREKRIDDRIKQKKKEIQLEKIEKLKATQEEIQKYQQDYQQFVAQFMRETERKEKEEKQKEKEKKQKKTISHEIDQKFILALPQLNEQERRLINIYNHDIEVPVHHHHHPIQQINAQQQKVDQKQMQYLLQCVQQKMKPLISQFQPLIDKLTNLQVAGLQRIKRNQKQINKRCSLNLQQIVKTGCKRMLLTLSTRIKKQIESATNEIYQLEDKNRQYYEQSIEQFKSYIKYQITNRIEIFYKSRKRLQIKLIEMSKDIVNPPKQSK